MKRKGLVLLLALAVVLCFSASALAVPPPPGGIINIDPIADLQLTQVQLDAGYDVSVTGYVGFDNTVNDNSNQGRLDTLELAVEKNGSGMWTIIQYIDNDPPLAREILAARGGVSGREFNFTTPWTISETGSYLLRVTATFTGPFSGAEGTEAVEITLLTTPPIIVDYPAAPAVAAAILKNAGIPHRYDTGNIDKKGKAIYSNYISDVAHMMGSSAEDENGSWFMGIDKCNEQEYYEAVYNYLKDLGAPLGSL